MSTQGGFMRRSLVFLLLLVSASAFAAERYSVVVVTGFDRAQEYKMLSDTELKVLKESLGSESILFSRALSAAAKEWAADPSKEKKRFPMLVKRTVRVLQTFSNQEDADKKLKSYEPKKEDPKSKDSKNKPVVKKPVKKPDEKKVLAEKQQQALMKDAIALLIAQIDALSKGEADKDGEDGEVKPAEPAKPVKPAAARDDAEDLE